MSGNTPSGTLTVTGSPRLAVSSLGQRALQTLSICTAPGREEQQRLVQHVDRRLRRLRYLGSATVWGFGLYPASSDRYEDQILPTGSFTGTPEEALDCACGLYLAGPAL